MLELIRRLGADAAEVYEEKTTYRQVSEGVLTRRVEKGIALRVLKSGRLIFLSSPSPEDALSRLKSAAGNLKHFPKQNLNFPRVYDRKRAPQGYDPFLDSSTFQSRLDTLSCSFPLPFIEYREKIKTVSLYNSEGLSLQYACSYLRAGWRYVTGGLHSPATTFWIQKRFFQDLLKECWSLPERDRETEHPASPLPGVEKVLPSSFVLKPSAVRQVLQVTAGQFYGGSHPPEQVSPEFSLIDDGTLPGGWGTEPADGEGCQPRKTVLYQDGHLEGLLYDALTGGLYGHCCSGNCIRQDYQTLPRIGSTNLVIPPSTMSFSEFMEGEKAIPVVKHFLTLRFHPPDVEGIGIWEMRHYGEPAGCVYTSPIRWNFRELLRKISGRFDDFRLCGHYGSPSLLI